MTPRLLWAACAGLAFAVAAATAGAAAGEFSPYVDDKGKISVPDDFRTWAYLGTWAVAGAGEDAGSKAFHNVYTKPRTVDAYLKDGRFPDGAVLVKELLKAATADMTTGRVSHAVEVEGWFAMVKDGAGRFKGNPLWGDGWGWALFKADNRGKTVTTDYRGDCIPRHIPAKATDWVYVEGYPVLDRGR